MQHLSFRIVLGGFLALSVSAAAQDGDSNPLGEMGDALSEIERVDKDVSPDLAEQVAALASVDAALLSSATFYAAKFALQEGEPKHARVILMPTESADDPGRLAIAVDADTGVVLTTALWGRSMFDEDPEGDWLAFLSQFKATGTLGFVIDPDEAPSAEELVALDESISDGGAVAAHDIPLINLYRHRYMMLKNGAYFTKSGALRRQGQAFTADVLRDWQGGLLWLCGQADAFEPIMGEAAAQRYRELAQPVREIFGAAIEAAQQEDHQGAANALRPLYRSVCQACHEVSDHPLGERSLYWELRDELKELGVRTDLGLIGTDAWGPRGEHRDLSRVLARQVRAGLMVLGSE